MLTGLRAQFNWELAQMSVWFIPRDSVKLRIISANIIWLL